MTSSPDLTDPPDLSHARPMRPLVGRRPVYVDLLAPCNAACRAAENVQGWLAHAQAGDHEGAFRTLTVDNPFPAIHGRVCYHPCESSCNRADLDAPVGIHAVERFIGDRAIERGDRFTAGAPTGKRILVVGAGPSGLSAAYHLRKAGHEVEIRDAGRSAGGMMVTAIPAYRLPRKLVADEVARITEMGVRILLGHRVEDVAREKTEGSFDAAFVAVGAQLGKKIDIPACDAGRVLDALSFLERVSEGQRPVLGRRVAVYGGGNTAMDAARVAARLGYEPLVIYRRDRRHMPARSFEADEAAEEGVVMNWLRSVKAFTEGAIEVEIMELDAHGKAHGTGRTETIAADSLVLALGQDADTRCLSTLRGIEIGPDGTLKVDEQFRTGHEGIFAGGDVVPSERTVAAAVGHGRAAALQIDAFVRNASPLPREKRRVARLQDLTIWYRTDAPKKTQEKLREKERLATFDEVVAGLSPRDATFEAKRCLSCGNCYECDGCFGACPSEAVIKLGKEKGYRIDLDRCTGCAVCYEQCPVHAMEMVPKEIRQP